VQERIDAARDRPWRPDHEHRLLAAAAVGFDGGGGTSPAASGLGERAPGIGLGEMMAVLRSIWAEGRLRQGMSELHGGSHGGRGRDDKRE
jgi:hypothetical protein